MKQEAISYQEEQIKYQISIICFFPPPRRKNDFLRIRYTASGLDSIDYHGISNDLTNSLFEFYFKNRNVNYWNLSKSERNSLFPFYNIFTPQECKSKIRYRQKEFEEVKNVVGVDSTLIEYYGQKVISAERELKMIQTFGVDSVYSIGELCRVGIDCPNSQTEYNRILDSVIEGFYQLRNYECMRYFHEPYLDLFERANRRKRQIDINKLDALKWLIPIRVIDYENT